MAQNIPDLLTVSLQDIWTAKRLDWKLLSNPNMGQVTLSYKFVFVWLSDGYYFSGYKKLMLCLGHVPFQA